MTFEGRRTYTWNVDEMAPLARAGKRDERVGLEPKEAKDALHAVVDLTAEEAEEQWHPNAPGHPDVVEATSHALLKRHATGPVIPARSPW